MRVAVMTRRTSTRFAFPFFLIALFILGRDAAVAAAESTTCDSCKYDGSDTDDCKVYGQLGDDVLIPYHKASQDCLDAHSIKVEAVDANMLSSMFPNADGSDANVNAFVSWLKNDSGAAVNAILLSMDFFFVEPATTASGQKPVFLDSIIVKGITYDCTASQSDCWNALKIYFETDEGRAILTSIGQDLYDKAAVGRELEQSTVRIAICNDGAKAEACNTLAAQIQELKTANPEKACSAFGLGPGPENAIPGCNGATDADGDDTDTTGNSTSRDTTTTSSATTATTTTGWFSVLSGSGGGGVVTKSLQLLLLSFVVVVMAL